MFAGKKASRAWDILPQALAIAAFLAFSLAKGVPALRHDWWMSAHAPALAAQAAAGFATWRSDGIGNPTLYPNDFLFYVAIFVLVHVVPPVVVLGLVLLAFASLCALAARTLPGARDPFLCAGATAILIFNPWVYTQLVAGHLPMLLAFSGMALFAAEACKGRDASMRRLLPACVLICLQLQFLLILLPATALFWLLCKRALPLITTAIAGIPVWAGVLMGRSELAAIPYTLTWEQSQSLHLRAAVLLSGYFAHYDDALGTIEHIATAIVGLLALAAAAFARTRATLLVALATLVTILIVLGTNGPTGPLYAFAVTHVHATGVFRELYDLVAFIAIAYIVAIALGSRSSRLFGIGASLAGVLMIAAWCVGPPARYWVAASALPVVPVHAPPQTRFALFPAFQPIEFDGHGSGADPDIYDRADGITPLNTYLPAYPAAVALVAYRANGDTSALRGLSVSTIVERPSFCTDLGTLAAQTASRAAERAQCGTQAPPRALDATPELSLLAHSSIVSLARRIGAGNILGSDAARAGLIAEDRARLGALPVAAEAVDARSAWVDARLFFVAHPEIGQAYGGVYTESAEPLTVEGGTWALASIDGALLDERGHPLAVPARGYRWIAIPSTVTAVHCIGRCTIAAISSTLRAFPLEAPAQPSAALVGRAVLPWLWQVDLPALQPGNLIRLNVTYTGYWKASLPSDALAHVRVDGAVNGWIARQALPAQRIELIEWRSALLQLCELIVAAYLLVLLAVGLMRVRT